MAQETGRVCRIGDWVSFFILAVKLCSDIAGHALGKDRLAMRLSETRRSRNCDRRRSMQATQGTGTWHTRLDTTLFCAIQMRLVLALLLLMLTVCHLQSPASTNSKLWGHLSLYSGQQTHIYSHCPARGLVRVNVNPAPVLGRRRLEGPSSGNKIPFPACLGAQIYHEKFGIVGQGNRMQDLLEDGS